ncbi:MAG: hypothetical protein FAF03_03800 [Epsilonproteobacteria bacterium]|nr:hypothetical protein [Campylobacterota bacterium]
MKNMLESFAIFLVGLLSLAVIYLIVQYNMIEEDSIDDISAVISSNKKAKVKVKTSAYLNSLEGYGDDVDVKVDARKEDHTNEVAVKSEITKDDLGAVVEDKSKSSYMENLEHYAEEADKKSSEPVKVQENVNVEKKSSGEPEKLPQEEVSDEIGEAIDAALDGL